LQESNLLGTRTVALLGYRNDPDRSAITAAFDTPRAIDNRIGIGASIVERSDGRGGTGTLRLPFLSLSSRTGGSLTASVFQGRVLQFSAASSPTRSGASSPSFAPTARLPSRPVLVATFAWDSSRNTSGTTWCRWKSRDTIPRTRSGAAGPYIAARAPRFIRVRNIERIGRIEDIDLGPFATLTLLAAPTAWGIRA
jgi:hypothetical protein